MNSSAASDFTPLAKAKAFPGKVESGFPSGNAAHKELERFCDSKNAKTLQTAAGPPTRLCGRFFLSFQIIEKTSLLKGGVCGQVCAIELPIPGISE
ncbi:hypothetical protein [Agrobacterium tumefaciens]|uniref:Uncharacterized protein n=1 Tax=Agrobacterium tumefaciens TaxID=358 RepID=A0A4D7YI11_AGRTU|nr:hypothetical protein [Agrobacterium tumefaciens]QCL97121.1 hypothetical protein CFBP7129_23590 [Agrobacterium tumefaciens]